MLKYIYIILRGKKSLFFCYFLVGSGFYRSPDECLLFIHCCDNFTRRATIKKYKTPLVNSFIRCWKLKQPLILTTESIKVKHVIIKAIPDIALYVLSVLSLFLDSTKLMWNPTTKHQLRLLKIPRYMSWTFLPGKDGPRQEALSHLIIKLN